MKHSTWKNCYSQQWAGILIPAAFAHPAKISLALAKKIFAHALEQGWIRKGDTCVDPFAGVGGVAFGAMAAGLNFIGQELEPHFVEIANGMDCTDEKLCPTCIARNQQSAPETLTLFDEPNRPHRFEGNLEFWKRKFGLSGAVIVQGDSRKLLENLPGRVECVVSSPPFCDGGMGDKRNGGGIKDLSKLHVGLAPLGGLTNYGESPSNLGNLPAGDFDLVVSSPPYADSIRGNGNGIDFSKIKDGGTNRTAAREEIGTGYGGSSAQLAAMPEGCFDIAVSSPPFGGSESHTGGVPDYVKAKGNGFPTGVGYGLADGQLGQSTGETFWSAAREIVQQCFLALKPGGHAIWVCKNFVRKGQIVEFSQQWAKLCESVGFKLVCWHLAMLTDEGAVQINLDGEETRRVRERKSFFRRLAEKNGSPPIDWEDVICFVKPAQTFERLFIDGRNGAAKLKTETVEV